MTLSLFIFILTIGAAVTGLLTESIKKFNENCGKETNPNIAALVCAFVVGGLGTLASYSLMDIPFTVNNIICVLLMIVCVWIGAMIGFDKVKQTLEQIRGNKEG